MSEQERLDAIALKNQQDFLERLKRTPGPQQALEESKLVEGGVGRATVTFKVKKEHLNVSGTMHGGMGAILVDNVTGVSLMNDDPEAWKTCITSELGVSYMTAAREGDDLLVKARVLKNGRTLAFTECEIWNQATKRLVLKGHHNFFKFTGLQNKSNL